MKIALVIPSFLPVVGGAEIGAFELARRLARRGQAVSVITPRLDRRSALRETMDGLEVRRYGVPGQRRTAGLLVASWWRLGALFRSAAPDLVNLHYLLPTGVPGQWWASRLGIPTVITLIGMDIFDPDYRPASILRFLMRRAIREGAAVTCISTFVRDVVGREYPPPPGVPFTVVPHGVDVRRFHPETPGQAVRARYGVSRAEKLVLTVQRLYPRKGVEHLVRAAAVVSAKHPDAKFLIVGEGPERRRIEALVKDLDLVDRVVLVGQVAETELPAFYAASDLFAFHTFHEGLGIVLLEAIASGRAVVTTQAGGTTDIIRHGENGVVVPPGDHEIFAEAVIELLGDDARRAMLGARGRWLAETEFDWERVTDRYLEVFTQVLSWGRS